ncbi:MAG: hypothetical protein Q8929_15870 [Bacillota bacterium]|nr:hypothetical protein [Bacillota bacterium]
MFNERDAFLQLNISNDLSKTGAIPVQEIEPFLVIAYLTTIAWLGVGNK